MSTDPRRPFLALLERYRTRHPGEAATVERFVEFVGCHHRCFDRELAVGHLTASAWLLSRDRRRVLLTHHRKLDAWLQLGGHTDGEHDLLLAALREAVEESGIAAIEPVDREIFDLDIHEIPERRRDDGRLDAAHLHYDVRFALRTLEREDYRVSDESHALAWVEIEAVARDAGDESLRRMARKWLDTAARRQVPEHSGDASLR